MTTLSELIEASDLPEEARLAALRACTTRGKRKGMLKKSPPKNDHHGVAAWEAFMLELNAARFSAVRLMCTPAETRATFEVVSDWATANSRAVNLGAQLPFEFNLYHARNAA